MIDTALNGKSQCVPGVNVYINMQQDVAGDSMSIPPAQCGGQTQLTTSIVTCVTDANGQVVMAYTAPSVIPAYGNVLLNDCISLAKEPQCQSYVPNFAISWRSWYQYLLTYRFSPSPIAASGSLAGGQAVPVTLQAAGPDGTPQANTAIYLALQTAASPSPTVTVDGTTIQLNGTLQQVTTDSSGQVRMTYTAPATVPSSGVDTIIAQSDPGATPVTRNATSYAYATGYPVVSIGDATTTEGDNHPNITAHFNVTLSSPSVTNVTLTYFTICGIGDKECGEDIRQVKTPKAVTIPAGSTSAVIPVTVYSYSSLEPYDETYLVQVATPSGAVLGRSIGFGLLLGDNETTLALLLYAGGGGVVVGSTTQTERVEVVLSSPAGSDVSFQYATSDGTAIAGVDYTATSGTATIAAGLTQATILVPVLPNTSPGASKAFSITISAVTGPAAIQLASGSVVIYNNN